MRACFFIVFIEVSAGCTFVLRFLFTVRLSAAGKRKRSVTTTPVSYMTDQAAVGRQFCEFYFAYVSLG